jgi:TolB protein
MKRFNKLWKVATATCVLILAGSARAQNDVVEVEKYTRPGNEKPIPVSMSGFTGESAEVIQYDLYVQGFSFTTPDVAQYLLNGSNNGNLTGQATDRFNKSTLVSKGYTGATLRRQAHAFADDFVRALNRKGIAQTKIAFKVDTGANSEIYVADFDGHNAQGVTHDNTIVAAPAWVPGRFALCYTSYHRGNPDIFRHDLSTGQRDPIAKYSGFQHQPRALARRLEGGDDFEQGRQPGCVCLPRRWERVEAVDGHARG